MPEVMFVVKSFIVSLLIVAALQVKFGERRLEAHTFDLIQSSVEATGLQNIAQGGALFLKNAGASVSGFVSKTFGHDNQSQKAGRLGSLQIKRSAAYEKEQENDEGSEE